MISKRVRPTVKRVRELEQRVRELEAIVEGYRLAKAVWSVPFNQQVNAGGYIPNPPWTITYTK